MTIHARLGHLRGAYRTAELGLDEYGWPSGQTSGEGIARESFAKRINPGSHVIADQSGLGQLGAAIRQAVRAGKAVHSS